MDNTLPSLDTLNNRISEEVKAMKQLGKDVLAAEKQSKKLTVGREQDFLRTSAQICAKCGRSTMLTLDHIIPRQLLLMLGRDPDREYDKDNLQVLCRPCNTFKANMLDFSNPQTKPLLLKYLADL
jgi:5-methylcytosine-specific restriction endonuclease McrA